MDCLVRCSRRLGPAALVSGMLLFASPAAAQEAGARQDFVFIESGGDEAASDGDEDGRRTFEDLPLNVVRGIGGVWDSDSLEPLLIGGLAVGIGLLLDDEVREAIADEDDRLADFAGDNLGPTGLGVLTLGLFIGGRYSDDDRFRAMSYDLAVASVVNLGYTAVLKEAVGRERPNGSNDRSFPSGHTSNAFALASVADAHYGRKVGIPAYVAASLVGVSRLRSDAHWLSDVLAGAALGHIVGRAVVRQNGEDKGGGGLSAGAAGVMLFPAAGVDGAKLSLGKGGSSLGTASVMPVLAPGFVGVEVGMRF